jgi:peptide/nickel transport system ATP-binding protein
VTNDTLLDVQGLKKYFPIQAGFFKRTVGNVKAVDGVSFSIRPREVFGLVGESGCGKTTTAMTVLRAHTPTAGSVLFHDSVGGRTVDLATLSEKELRPLRAQIQVVFQDPYSSLNPRMTVREIVAEPLIVAGNVRRKALDDIVVQMLEKVQLNPAYLTRYPHAFSGGQRQRIAIARALSIEPQFLVCDESVSALDVSVQAQILNLLRDLQRDLGLSYLFIAHDLSVVKHICDRVGVMYVGRMAEITDTETLFRSPAHPYTESLLSSVPRTDPDRRRERQTLEGEVPDPADPPTGCYFHPRCRYAKEICSRVRPELEPMKGNKNQMVACHFRDELSLQGIKDDVPLPGPTTEPEQNG